MTIYSNFTLLKKNKNKWDIKMKRKKVKKILNKTLPAIPYISQHIVMINDCFCFYTSFRIETNILRLYVCSEEFLSIRLKDIKKFKRFS